MTKLFLYSVVTAAMAAAVTAGTASASTRLYNQYACTLQGEVGLTYIIESSSATCDGWYVSFLRPSSRVGHEAPSLDRG
jgi:hypothetical protein